MTKNYYYDGDRLIAEKWSTGAYLLYHYDETGSPYAITYSATGGGYAKYYLIKNLQGDVLQIRNVNNAVVANYEYDAWGRVVSVKYANGNDINVSNHIGVINPIRYRGYYYDSETGFYYLKSRYYDPAICRFISADDPSYLGAGETTQGLNLFAYCLNDPVNYSDSDGQWPSWATKLVVAVAVVAVVATVAAVTVATAGAGTAAAAIAVGAAKGAAAGMASGAAIGAATGAVSHRVSTGSWDGAGESALSGMANGALSGAISGAVSGGIAGGLNYYSSVASPGKGFDSFRQLKNEIGSPGPGNKWHHIVEQSQVAKSGFSPQMIQNTNNIISISKKTHRAISGYYSSVQLFTDGMTVRNWLAGQNFRAQYKFGISIIKMFK